MSYPGPVPDQPYDPVPPVQPPEPPTGPADVPSEAPGERPVEIPVNDPGQSPAITPDPSPTGPPTRRCSGDAGSGDAGPGRVCVPPGACHKPGPWPLPRSSPCKTSPSPSRHAPDRRADLAIAPGDRTCLVGRNGSGKSTLLRIAAGLVEPDRGRRFVQPGATIRYLAQEPDFSGHATALSFVEAGLGPGDDAYRARYLLESLGLTGDEDPARMSGGESRRPPWPRHSRRSPTFSCSTSRPTISTCRRSSGWRPS